jgi:hypothetical protein
MALLGKVNRQHKNEVGFKNMLLGLIKGLGVGAKRREESLQSVYSRILMLCSFPQFHGQSGVGCMCIGSVQSF